MGGGEGFRGSGHGEKLWGDGDWSLRPEPALKALGCHAVCLAWLGHHNKPHRLGGLNSRHLFITILDPRKSQVKVLVRSFLLVCRQLSSFLSSSGGGRESLGSSCEDTNRIMGPHPPDLIATHCPSQTSPPNSVISLRVRVSMHEF